jgi:predicted Fe-Mo cluster-binding NifX family protein
MRIAITATDKHLDAEMDPRFGRAQFILIVDPGGTIVDVIDNEPNRAAMGGAGIGAAKMLSDKAVNVLLTGRCGPNARTALDAAGIEICEVQAGTVRDALERFNRGEVSSSDEADREAAAKPAGMPGTPGFGGGRGMGRGMGMGRGQGRGQGRGRGMGRGGGMGRGRGTW